MSEKVIIGANLPAGDDQHEGGVVMVKKKLILGLSVISIVAMLATYGHARNIANWGGRTGSLILEGTILGAGAADKKDYFILVTLDAFDISYVCRGPQDQIVNGTASRRIITLSDSVDPTDVTGKGEGFFTLTVEDNNVGLTDDDCNNLWEYILGSWGVEFFGIIIDWLECPTADPASCFNVVGDRVRENLSPATRIIDTDIGQCTLEFPPLQRDANFVVVPDQNYLCTEFNPDKKNEA